MRWFLVLAALALWTGMGVAFFATGSTAAVLTIQNADGSRDRQRFTVSCSSHADGLRGRLSRDQVTDSLTEPAGSSNDVVITQACDTVRSSTTALMLLLALPAIALVVAAGASSTKAEASTVSQISTATDTHS